MKLQQAQHRRAVFLDRDGVLVKATVIDGRPHAPQGLDELEWLPRVREALADLKRAKFLLIVVTNQPDVATRKQRRAVVEAMHRRLADELPVDEIRVCYHGDSDGCLCRKPKPGMLLDAATHWSIDLEMSYMVGDRWRDVGAGRAAGCRTIFVDHSYREALDSPPWLVVSSMWAAAQAILAARD